MKLLKKIQLKSFALWVLLFALTLSLFTGITFKASAETTEEETSTEITYIDTEVERIAFTQHPTCVFFGFELKDSDYNKFSNWEGDFAGTATHKRYEEYIALELTYWKNFSDMNSEGVIFDQLYAYWDAGRNPTSGSHALMHSMFANTVAHRSTLALLEYGFVISIPAGTTFPSATFVHGKCEGAPIMYRTKSDIAFYYNGSKFEVFPYEVAQERVAVVDELNGIDLDNYYEAEQNVVTSLVEDAKKQVLNSFSSFAIQDALATFYEKLDEVMTVEDYAILANKKTDAKAELATFFNGLSQEMYEEAEWNAILAIQGEADALIDGRATLGEVEAAVISVKLSVDKVLTKEEKGGFADYQAAAIAKVENAFVESLYRADEKEQGKALIQEAKALIQEATTHDGVDGVALTYIARIDALKTDAEWTEEENRQESANDSTVEDSTTNNQNSATDNADEEGCNSSINGLGIIFGMAVVAMLTVINKNRKEKKNEN